MGAFANVLCEYDAAAAVPDFTLKAERDAAEAACIASKYGDNHWKLVCTATMTHAALQLIFCGLAPWVVPLRQWHAADAAWWLFTVGTAAAILLSGVDFIARGAGGAGAFTSTGSGLDPFEVAAAVYTGVWGLAMLVGSPKGWKLRPPLGALCLSWLFWIVVLVIKCAIDAP